MKCGCTFWLALIKFSLENKLQLPMQKGISKIQNLNKVENSHIQIVGKQNLKLV